MKVEQPPAAAHELARAGQIYESYQRGRFCQTDRVFAVVMAMQFAFGLLAANWISPRTWSGDQSSVHLHVYAAVVLGGALAALPLYFIFTRPGTTLTRHTIAIAQALTSALLIHLTGGRIETHFHVFGSLAFLSFYRDWKVLVSASAVVAADHFLRGIYWPQSVYGVLTASEWRWLEHAGWVVFEDIFLITACRQGNREMRQISLRDAQQRFTNERIEALVEERTRTNESLTREIAERERAQQELERANYELTRTSAEAEAANRAKSDFLACMSHEIRTPMNGITGMIQLLLKTDMTSRQERYALIARSSVDTLLKLINDILDFSKIESGKMDLERKSLNLRTLVEDVVSTFSNAAAEKGIELLCALDPRVPVAVEGDAVRLRQILTNLVSNAVKFTEKGEVCLTVDVRDDDLPGTLLHFTVKDTGIGIPADRRNRLFRSFRQLDASTTRKYGGTGLGLAICRKLVTLMGGEIGVDSEAGKGTAFWFTLRLREGSAVPGQLPRTRRGFHALRTLVVDDNATNREILEGLLRSHGFDVESVASGAAALDRLHDAERSRTPFAVAIVDLHMPGMNGLELAGAVKQAEDIRDTALIMLASIDHPGDNDLDGAGFASRLVKPVREEELLAALEEACGSGPTAEDLQRDGARADLEARVEVAPPALLSGRILLVEDNDVNQLVTAGILEELGLGCDVATTGQEAIDAILAIPYDLVLMDCQMPEMDGYQATRAIRAAEQEGRKPAAARSRVPIVALTANALNGQREQCIEAGMDAYLSKPVDAGELQETVGFYLRPLCSVPEVEVDPTGSRRAPCPEAAADPGDPCSDTFSDRDDSTRGTADGDVSAPLDMAELDARCLGKTLLVERVLEKFRTKAGGSVAELAAAIGARDAARAGRLAHSLKGVAANLSAAKAAGLAAAIEELVTAGSFDVAAVSLEDLRAEVQRCLDYISVALARDSVD